MVLLSGDSSEFAVIAVGSSKFLLTTAHSSAWGQDYFAIEVKESGDSENIDFLGICVCYNTTHRIAF